MTLNCYTNEDIICATVCSFDLNSHIPQIGLAVDDIQGIKKAAEVQRLKLLVC